jgi:uncharacterized protein (DUF2252 family)
MAEKRVAHPTIEERKAQGKQARVRAPLESQAVWAPASRRPNPVDLIEAQNATREQDLVPVRHGRMMVSPFTFYRGSAAVMASDLAGTPTAGLNVQLCGDAHLSNFGGFGSPERTLVFDVNDFDETLPGPFEFDLKRLATSFTVAARDNGFSKSDAKAATLRSVSTYREAMTEFAAMGVMDIWYAHLTDSDLLDMVRAAAGTDKQKKKMDEVATKNVEKAHSRDSLQALSKLCELVDGRYRITSVPPVVIPARDLPMTFGSSHRSLEELVHHQLTAYRATLRDDRRHLLERFEFVDAARKVVGVGSVGTRAFIALMQGRDSGDPLFLQVKEATSSVLEAHLPKSRYANHGERVVQGQLMMQAASDIFLGWTVGADTSRHYYWRQLRDMKSAIAVEAMTAAGLATFAHACGWTLARAHARSGDPVAIAAYLGKSDRFDRAVTEFSRAYADQNDADFKEFTEAIQSGRLQAVPGV